MGEPISDERQDSDGQKDQSSAPESQSGYQSLRSINSTLTFSGSLGNSFSGHHSNVVTCPTCKGLGRVPKESEKQLMALIPMTDGRLKPQRTVIYVLVAIGVCVVTAALLIFFLIPRDIVISSNKPFLQSDHIYVNASAKFANFTVYNHYNISNDNFYAVTLKEVYMKAQLAEEVLSETCNDTKIEIDMRSEKHLTVPMTFVFQGNHGSIVLDIKYSFMDHTEQDTLTTYQLVSCYPDSQIVTTSTPLTTAASTTTATRRTTKRRKTTTSRRSRTTTTTAKPSVITTSLPPLTIPTLTA